MRWRESSDAVGVINFRGARLRLCSGRWSDACCCRREVWSYPRARARVRARQGPGIASTTPLKGRRLSLYVPARDSFSNRMLSGGAQVTRTARTDTATRAVAHLTSRPAAPGGDQTSRTRHLVTADSWEKTRLPRDWKARLLLSSNCATSGLTIEEEGMGEEDGSTVGAFGCLQETWGIGEDQKIC